MNKHIQELSLDKWNKQRKKNTSYNANLSPWVQQI